MPEIRPPEVTDHAVRPSRQVPSRLRVGSATLQTAAVQLLPVPFVDDWLTGRVRRRLVRRALEERNITFDGEVPAILATHRTLSLKERMRNATVGLAVKPLRKAFRTVFLWLTARAAVRAAVDTYLLARFVNHPGFSFQSIDRDAATSLAAVFAEVSEDMDRHLATNVLDRLWRFLRSRGHAAARFTFSLGDVSEALAQERPDVLADFDDQVARRLSSFVRHGGV